MDDERIPCTNSDCHRTILPSTAERTGGICMPCQQAKDAEKHREYIEKNRKTVNPFEGISDLVEIIKISHLRKKYDPLIQLVDYPEPLDRVYAKLNAQQQQELINYIIECIHHDNDNQTRYSDILQYLITFTQADFSQCIELLVEDKIFENYLSAIFLYANSDIRDKLLKLVEKDKENRLDILFALAWIGDDVVVQQFANWQKKPPDWINEAEEFPDRYTQFAGWELDANNQRRNLYFSEAVRLVYGDSNGLDAIQTGIPDHRLCQRCNGKLNHSLIIKPNQLNLNTITYSPTIPVSPLSHIDNISVLTCEYCASYSGVDFGYFNKDKTTHHLADSNNKTEPSKNYLNEDEWIFIPTNTLIPAPQLPVIKAGSWQINSDYSQIGGRPLWTQDYYYPTCPCCQQRMIFLSQISLQDTTIEPTEGVYYSFICVTCNTTATTYQQT